MPFPFFSRFLAFAILLIALPLAAQQDDTLSLGKLTPKSSYEPTVIAVTAFNASGTGLEIETIPRIIRRDLELTGLFKMPADQLAANRQNLRDNKQGGIEFDQWKKMNVHHYVMGRVINEGENYKVRILLYDIASESLVMNRYFSDKKERYRELAHLISDEIVKYLKGIDGIARTKFLFVSEQVPGTKELAVMDADGFNARPVTNFGKLVTTPEWGANGTEVYFTSYHGNRGNLYGMKLQYDGINLLPGPMWTIAAYGGTNHSPAWNQQRKQLVMVLSKDGNSELYRSDRSGKSLSRLTRTQATEGSPTWSPDGSKIAFTSNESGGVHIYIMDADGSNRRRITRAGSWNDAVSWSPDGRRLVFVSRQAGVNDIYLCNADGSPDSFKRLTMNQGDNESPVWAPNGTHIAFASNRSGRWQAYILLDDGSNQRQITAVGSNTMPDWGPIPKIGN